jgi:hypothetical protein
MAFPLPLCSRSFGFEVKTKILTLLKILKMGSATFDARVDVHVIGASAFILDGLIARDTEDLDFLCLERKIQAHLPCGFKTHQFDPAHVLTRGWVFRSRLKENLSTPTLWIYVQELHDRIIHKVARGLPQDLADVREAVRTSKDFDPTTLSIRTRSMLKHPPADIFDQDRFLKNFDLLFGDVWSPNLVEAL